MKLKSLTWRLVATPSVTAALIGSNPSRRDELRAALETPLAARAILTIMCIRLKRFARSRMPYLLILRRHARSATPDGDEPLLRQVSPLQAGASAGDHARMEPRDADSFPMLIFQTWKSKVNMPASYARWSASFRTHNRDFEYVLWDDHNNRGFISAAYPWFLPVYDAYPREIFRVDAVRYFFLYTFGGVYADMDTECLAPLSPLFGSGDVWLGRMGSDSEFAHSIPNAIMASRPLQSFWLLVIHLMMEKAAGYTEPALMACKGPEALTGPILLKEAYDQYTRGDHSSKDTLISHVASRLPYHLQPRAARSRIVMFTSETWYPLDWSNAIHHRLCSQVVDFHEHLDERVKRWLFPNSSMVTYWTHSWKPTPTEI